jgi:heat shock protein HtpX
MAVMDFWQAQRRARKETAVYVTLFAILTIVAAVLLELGLRYFAPDQYNPPTPYMGLIFLVMTFGAACVQYYRFTTQGGKYVPESMGARKVKQDCDDLKEQMLLNIVEEIALASALPIPPVYIIEAEEINAFAAGLKPENAVIAITQGALNKLSRDEIQGVVAHEFGHIKNGDMRIGLRLAAMIMGFYFILYFALRILQISGRSKISRGGGKKGADPILIAVLLLLAAGVFTWFFGSILKAAVSRQREYLADASSVQFTRNPEGLANALRKIEQENISDMPKTGIAYSHLYLDDHNSWSSLFATHPPIKKRIAAIEASVSS